MDFTFIKYVYSAKQIQWYFPEEFGVDKLLLFFGDLHLEKQAYVLIGNLLEGSGWTDLLCEAEITTSGSADSMISASHIKRTRDVHQTTLAALHLLKREAYECRTTHEDLDFDSWNKTMKSRSPMFLFWDLVIKLEKNSLQLVKSLRTGNWQLYIDAVKKVLIWFFVFDHPNYARAISLHLADLLDMEERHPNLARAFKEKKFCVQKTKNRFSLMAMDQAHEQLNAKIKGNGGAVGLFDNKNSLNRWMTAGPVISDIIDEFLVSCGLTESESIVGLHHEECKMFKVRFNNNVKGLVDAFKVRCNPFDDDPFKPPDLFTMHTREVVGADAVTLLYNLDEMGNAQAKSFFDLVILKSEKSLWEIIQRNSVDIFNFTIKAPSTIQSQVQSMKKNASMLQKLYFAYFTRQGDMSVFFHTNPMEFLYLFHAMDSYDLAQRVTF